ncbi:MAG: hypothetical protein L0387_13480 [Acidobacteria bacterium]|nr:hypothetical protein [Acidobacteriota bacterium]MCI0721921.1 hypothetical protein [Acidobacteriota bacterium]
MKVTRRQACLASVAAFRPLVRTAGQPLIEIWYGDTQSVGQCGDLQEDFNLIGHVEPWREIDSLLYSVNGTDWIARAPTPLAFRAYRRLVEEGDFNADIPIGLLKPGANTIVVTAKLWDGRTASKQVTVHLRPGSSLLPFKVEWSKIDDPQKVGQYVDGKWSLEKNGLRTRQVGYDRVFLVGERSWKDYEVRTSITVHEVKQMSGGNGVGVILRFAGHISGGPRFFPSWQPKWGYQPFGAIGWLRWPSPFAPKPRKQFFPGDSDLTIDLSEFPAFSQGVCYGVRFACETLPGTDSEGVTRYSFKLWPESEREPENWDWQQVQTSRTALRTGGAALIAHHIDVTFGDVIVTPVPRS